MNKSASVSDSRLHEDEKMRRFIALPISLDRARSGCFYVREEARLDPTLSLLLNYDWLNKRSMHEGLS